MVKYLHKVKELLGKLSYFKIERVLRAENQQVDALSKLVSSSLDNPSRSVLVETLPHRTIEDARIMNIEAQDEE